MRWTARIAALHGAYWSFDQWYRLSWYVWPGAIALLACGWIYVEKPGEAAAPSAGAWAKPVAIATPQPVRRSPILANWPEKLQNDVITCFSNAIDLAPLIAACTRLIESGQIANPQLVAAYSQRGLHQRLKQPDSALEDYNAAVKIQPDTPLVLTNRAWIFMTRNQFDAAIADLNRAIELFPPAQAARSYYYRGYSYMKLMDNTRAMSDLNESLRLDPNAADPYLYRGEVERRQQLYDAALRDVDEHVKRAPRDVRGFVARGDILEKTGRVQEALAAVENALTVEPDNARAAVMRDQLRTQLNSAKQSSGGSGSGGD
jgi:tetratricopeptide (TPR) repeat protein